MNILYYAFNTFFILSFTNYTFIFICFYVYLSLLVYAVYSGTQNTVQYYSVLCT